MLRKWFQLSRKTPSLRYGAGIRELMKSLKDKTEFMKRKNVPQQTLRIKSHPSRKSSNEQVHFTKSSPKSRHIIHRKSCDSHEIVPTFHGTSHARKTWDIFPQELERSCETGSTFHETSQVRGTEIILRRKTWGLRETTSTFSKTSQVCRTEITLCRKFWGIQRN